MAETKQHQPFKFKANQKQINEMLIHYDGYQVYNDSPYVISRYKANDCTITIYKTNIILFQGSGAEFEYNSWALKFGLKTETSSIINREKYANLSAIGSDEVGTGDYFGPIVVCATYVDKSKIKELQSLGVKDSKMLSDEQIKTIGFKIAEMIPYSIVMLNPEKINSLKGEHNNINFIKAYLHNKAILSLKNKLENKPYEVIIMDQFAPKQTYFKYLSEFDTVEKDIVFVTKGEQAHIAVAAGSILARLAFLREIKNISNQYNMPIYKGAGAEVDKLAISFVKSFGYDELSKVVKLKWANTERVNKYFETNPLRKKDSKEQ